MTSVAQLPIAPAILAAYPKLNDHQRQVVGHVDGPLLVIAGPGSGKTFCLVLRAVNLLLLGQAAPSEIVLCTFTEKVAFELRDRVAAAARTVGYAGDLSALSVGTIHSLCNRILAEHRHRTPLGNNYQTLDDLTQLLFIFDHFGEIIGDREGEQYLGRWGSKWRAIKGITEYFNKITEELVDPEQLVALGSPFLRRLGASYQRYRDTLIASNHLDFAHQQKLVHDLLVDPAVAPLITGGIRYVLVDEYQDTNYIQEQLLLKLASATGNLCVVGDEDQSLYRFRGATVRNILEFPERVGPPPPADVTLDVNYRSHSNIVAAYDRWMASADWSNRHGRPFRFNKRIVADPDTAFPTYLAVFSIYGRNARDEAKRFAELVAWLKLNQVVEDYSQIALLLRSVRSDHSKHYIDALEDEGIPAYNPRARAYFENEEVRMMVACLALIFGYHGEGRGTDLSTQARGALKDLWDYIDACLVDLARVGAADPELISALGGWVDDIEGLREDEALDLRPADYYYRLLALEPFRGYLCNENRARNLSIFSQLLNVFQNHYHYSVVTHANRAFMRFHLFSSFLRLLHDGGINDYEDPDQPFPKGYVQVMTIHQAKGLEFPVVVVGSLADQVSVGKKVDRELQPFYHRPRFEPENRITDFDRMRLHYVAFSRAEKVLVLTASESPKPHFAPIWQGLRQWPYVQQDLLAAQSFRMKERMPVKRAYSFTGDLKVYETCPRQYQFFREYDFTPSRSAVLFFGLLVHQTIEEIHRIVLDGGLDTLTEARIRELFDRTFQFLTLSDVRPIGAEERATAFRHVMNYFDQNRAEMRRVIQTEVDVSVEMDDYILTGKVDLLMGDDRKLELLDFKTAPRPVESPDLVAAYHRQLCIYAFILQKRYNRTVERLLLYWTSEPRKADAVMVFPFDPALVQEAGDKFDAVIRRIRSKAFGVTQAPEAKVCKECDLRTLCVAEGILAAPRETRRRRGQAARVGS